MRGKRSRPSARISITCANRPASWCCPIASATPAPPWTRSWSTTTRELDWSKPETAAQVTEKSTAYEKTLDRCNATAADAVRKEPEFRRLIDGAKEGLALIPQAVKTRDTALLHRVLIQLRSFDNLLAFRFG